jgi:hypothetical protein
MQIIDRIRDMSFKEMYLLFDGQEHSLAFTIQNEGGSYVKSVALDRELPISLL